MTAASDTLTVAGLLAQVGEAVAAAIPGPVWVRGEVTGFRRTAGGAAFFRLADAEIENHSLDVAARGLVMLDVDRALDAAGLGAMRDGVAVRIRGTVGLVAARSGVRFSLLEVDPAFTAGRLAWDRQEVLRRMAADGSLAANGRLALPLVPLEVGLVTSRGSAAHADFLDQLRRSDFRFHVKTVHASMQGDNAAGSIVRALALLAANPVDVIVIARGGGSRLDLAPFDSEEVSRAVAGLTVPVVAGIGHEIDRSVVDEAAAVSVKTPTAAAEWLVGRVGEYAGRIDLARRLIADEARTACSRESLRLDSAAAQLGGVRETLARHHDRLAVQASRLVEDSRRALTRQIDWLHSVEEMVAALGAEATLRRGYALVMDDQGVVVRSAGQVQAGQRLEVRLAEGAISAIVESTGG